MWVLEGKETKQNVIRYMKQDLTLRLKLDCEIFISKTSKYGMTTIFFVGV